MLRVAKPASVATAAGRSRTSLVVRCEVQQQHSSSRRAVLAGVVGSVLSSLAPAHARDYKEALARKEARKAQLKEAAGKIKSSGQDQQVFKKSDYSLPEAHTPNIHTRQNEGARTQDNV